MRYDNPYCDAKATYIDDAIGGDFYDTFTKEEERTMSDASYDAVSAALSRWFARPDFLCCKLCVEDESLNLFISAPDETDHSASFSLSFAELVLSAGNTCRENEGVEPSVLSALLRELADKIDAAKEY